VALGSSKVKSEAPAEPEDIVFDVGGLRDVDTTFFRFLVRLRRHATKSRQGVKLIGVSRKIRSVFETEV
jgi:ABC-type transporter Mla MlaB component